MRVCVMCKRYVSVKSDSESYFLNVQSINKLQGTKIGERHRCCHVSAIFVPFVPWHSTSLPSGYLLCVSEHLLFVLLIEFANWNSTNSNFLLNFIPCSFTAFPLFHTNSDLCYKKNISAQRYTFISHKPWLQLKYCADIVWMYWERLAKASVNPQPANDYYSCTS